ncbi:MAG: YeeE/YedE family protein [Gallionellaceae bacterium]|nr:YeeE/YedE family protein [Gallionellaceae bacterium]MDD5364124.1 YeeE/YedE family protein [Gallionellaceae bacterium]
MEGAESTAQLVAWLGFVLALVFGYVANKTSFCTMGAVSDVVNMDEWGRMRAWLLAIAVATLGTGILVYLGDLDISKTYYTRETFYWLAALVGGLSFGVGMTLAGGCGQRTLVRLGGGNLKSVVVFLFLGYSALVSMNGVFRVFTDKVLRLDMFTIRFEHMQTLPSLFQHGDPQSHLMVAGALALAILIFVFASKEFRTNPDNITAGLVVGLVVVGGWYVTGKIGLAENEFMEMSYVGTDSKLAESMTFVGPLGYTMDLWAYWNDKHVTFGIACVFGVVIGSLLYSVFNRTFRWEYFNSPQDMFRHIIGAALMGYGGVTAMGCTIGQGVTGVSTLALGSFVVLFGIIAGAAVTMKVQYYLLMREA